LSRKFNKKLRLSETFANWDTFKVPLNDSIHYLIISFFFSETTYGCHVCLPQKDLLYERKQCIQYRNQQTSAQRHYFKLTTPIHPDAPNVDHAPLFPRLDQSENAIQAKAMFGDLDAKWFANYYGMVRALNETAARLMPAFQNNLMKTYADYKVLYNTFLLTLKVIL